MVEVSGALRCDVPHHHAVVLARKTPDIITYYHFLSRKLYASYFYITPCVRPVNNDSTLHYKQYRFLPVSTVRRA